MRTLKITDRTLLDLGACIRGRERFAALFPAGLVLTDNQVTNFERLAGAELDPGTVASDGSYWVPSDQCDLYWLAVTLSKRVQWREWSADMAGRSPLFYVAGLLADAVGCYRNRRR